MTRTACVPILTLLAVMAVGGGRAVAQSRQADTNALRAGIERRFDVLPLRDGVALRPKDSSRQIRSIEVTNGPIAIDGQPATGAEVRQRLGADADIVLELSYLSVDERRALFEPAGASAGAAEPPVARPSPPEPPGSPERPSRRPRSRSSNDRVRIGGGVTVGEGEIVEGNVVAVGGGATIDGEVRGDVVAIGGGITVGPTANVTNNVVVVGGTLRRDPAARIGGQVQEIGLPGLTLGRLRWPGSTARSYGDYWGSVAGTVLALLGTITRLAILCLLAALILLLGRGFAERAGDRAFGEPLKAGAIGFLAQLLFLPVLVITIIVLVLTIVGIPLLLLIPFLMLGLALVGLVGFTGVAQRIGDLVCARMSWRRDNPYLTAIIGVVVLLTPALLSRLVGLVGGFAFPMTFGFGLLGALVEYVAWTVGFGAVALTRFNRAQPSATQTTVEAGTV